MPTPSSTPSIACCTEAAEAAAMAARQIAANHAGAYLNTASDDERRQAVQALHDTLAAFDVALANAHGADIRQGDYYMLNEVIQAELKKKIARWQEPAK